MNLDFEDQDPALQQIDQVQDIQLFDQFQYQPHPQYQPQQQPQQVRPQRVVVFNARDLLATNNRGFLIEYDFDSAGRPKKTNGRNITKYIIKMFFKLIQPLKKEFEKNHWEEIMSIRARARDNGNTNHLKELFGQGETQERAQRNQINRKMAQQVISTKITRQILNNNSIKDKKNYIATCLCYVYRLNDPITAGSGVALVKSNNRTLIGGTRSDQWRC